MPRLATDRESVVISLVRILHTSCRPHAVTGLVVTVGFFSLDRMLAAGARTHVSNEVLELVPTGADCDAAPAVVRVAGSILVSATVQHVRPATVTARPHLPLL